MPNVSNIVKSIQDIMRKDAGTYGDAQRLEQLGWLFFLKIFDDREQEMALLRDDYKSPLPKALRWTAWAKDEEGITGDALLDFVNNTLLPQLKALTGSDRMHSLIRMAFEDANNYMKNGTLMRQVINKINGFKARVENEFAWRVPIEQIKAGNYNLDLKNPHNADEGPGDVDHLLPEYEKLLAQIAETRAKLKAQLMEALNR